MLVRRLVLAKLDFPNVFLCHALAFPHCFGAAVIPKESLTRSLLTVRCHCLEEHPVDQTREEMSALQKCEPEVQMGFGGMPEQQSIMGIT